MDLPKSGPAASARPEQCASSGANSEHPSRRSFIKATVGTLVALPLATPWETRSADTPNESESRLGSDRAPAPDSVPPHTGRVVPGVHAYADRESVEVGNSIHFHVSHTESCRLTVCRLGLQVDDPAGDIVCHAFPARPPRPQPIHPGSYVHVENGLDESEFRTVRGLTLEAWVRPWRISGRCGVLSQWSSEAPGGFALGLDSDGRAWCFWGVSNENTDRLLLVSEPGSLPSGNWAHLVAVWDGQESSLWVDGREVAQRRTPGSLAGSDQPIRLGALGIGKEAGAFLDGDLASVALYRRPLGRTEIQQRHALRGLVPPLKTAGSVADSVVLEDPKVLEALHAQAESAQDPDLLGSWQFAEEQGARVADGSRWGRHGQIINHGTWMIGGPSFQPEVARFGDYNPPGDTLRGHGLRLSSDDLYDCRWEISETWEVPREALPGMYVARIHWVQEGRPRLTHVPFVVRRSRRDPRANLLVLCSTNTWHAYNGAPFGVWPDSLHAVLGTGGLPNAPGDPPAFCLYRPHSGGQGTYQMGRRMPFPAGGPYVLYGQSTRYSHLLRAERFFHVWLEESGYTYDLVTDLDLHREPDLLEGRRCVVLNGHSEYWSLPAYSTLQQYLKSGGNLMVLSGNTLFWRVSFNEDGTVMECRKVDAPGDQLPASRRGECWHSQDGQRGGLLRECGYPGWDLCGLETLGWNNQDNARNFGPYEVVAADHIFFHKPEPTGLHAGDRFAMGPGGGLPLANGHEIDVRLSTLKRLQQLPDPDGGTVPPDPDGIVLLANGIIPWKEGGAAFDYYFRPVQPATDQGGEMIYWERPEGGRVFNAGSIGAGWALGADARYQVLMRNVLHHFGVERG